MANQNGNNGEHGLLRDLAQRLLTYHYPGEPEARTARLLPGEIASEFPADIPLPSDTRLIGSLVVPMHVTVVFDTSMTSEQLVDYYKERMISIGWTEPAPWPFFHEGGFQHNIMEQWMGSIFCRGTASLSVHIEASPADSSAQEVRLKYDTDPRVSHCAQQRRHRRQFPGTFTDVIPTLEAPPKSMQMPRGGGGRSDTHSETSAHLKTNLDLSSVARHYGDQLSKSGWQEQDSAQNGPMAWSTYEFKDEESEDWNAIFYAVALPKKEGEYLLFVEATMAGMEQHYPGAIIWSS